MFSNLKNETRDKYKIALNNNELPKVNTQQKAWCYFREKKSHSNKTSILLIQSGYK